MVCNVLARDIAKVDRRGEEEVVEFESKSGHLCRISQQIVLGGQRGMLAGRCDGNGYVLALTNDLLGVKLL